MQKTGKKQHHFAFDSLEAMRTKLLDLTARNSLLNYHHPRARCIRIIDELPDQLVSVLKSEKPLTFLGIPEPSDQELIDNGFDTTETTDSITLKSYPSAKQWAKQLGFNTNYELPEQYTDSIDNKEPAKPQHQDTDIQSVLYTAQLDAHLRNIRSNSATAIEESGANILFLCIGFLEWFESNNSDIKRIAPLYTLPVSLERSAKLSKKGKFTYTICLKDDDLLTNIALKEKLAHDFNLTLPFVDDEMLPEAYFQQVESTIIHHQPRWRIRRQATLLLLNFTKQAMYQDLDPKNWPQGASIEDHPLIAQFFGISTHLSQSSRFNNALNYESEHSIDDIEDIHDTFPLIFDADSSQHSALIDAVKGESLVIEGPPGSGKSQTITNLIAAAIANGKKVLFVAEKMAALNVVKDRLDKAGLGDFCLELHSHKTNKLTVLNALGTRIKKQHDFRNPTEIEVDIARFEALKHTLSEYVETINSPWKYTELSIHQILNKATRYREALKMNPEQLKIQGIESTTFTLLKQRELFDHADNLKSIYEQTSQQAPQGLISNHYWYGVRNTTLMGYQAEALQTQLANWTTHLDALKTQASWLNKQLNFGIENEEAITLSHVENITTQSQLLPALKGGELFTKIEYIVENMTAFEQWLKRYSLIHKNHQSLEQLVHQQAILDENSLGKLDQALETFTHYGLDPNSTLEALSTLTTSIKDTQQRLEAISDGFEQIIPNIPTQLKRCFSLNMEGFEEFQYFIHLLNALPTDYWRYRDERYDNPDLDPLLTQMLPIFKELAPLHKTLQPHFRLQQLPNATTLKTYADTLNNAGLFKWFSSTWRGSRNALLKLSTSLVPETTTLFPLLPDLIQYAEGIEQLDALNQHDSTLQGLYAGIETPIQRIAELREWYKKIRAEYGLGFGERVELGNALLILDRQLALRIKDSAQQQLSQHIKQSISNIRTYAISCHGFMPLHDKQSDVLAALSTLSTTLETHLVSLAAVLKGHTQNISVLSPLKKQLQQQQQLSHDWLNESITEDLKKQLPLSILPNQASQPDFDAAVNSLAISKILANETALLNSLIKKPNQVRYQALIDATTESKQYLQACQIAQNDFVTTGDVQLSEWMTSSTGTLNGLITKNRQALENPHWLNTWLDYRRLRNKLSTEGLTVIINQLETQKITPEQLKDTVKLSAYHQLTTEVFATHPTLASFSGMEQMAHRERFQEYDRKLMVLQRELVAYKASRVQEMPAGIANGRVRDYTEMGLIQHHIGQKRPRLSVRHLLKQAGTSIQILKPCFMMSPMSVSQYLIPGQFNFDIVVMDEASQIRPEDALGSIARGKSLVVVGDPKQLPPTSFFQKMLNNEDNDDKVGLEDAESILDSVLPVFKNRRLRWHYRSRHESLIAFSNYHFYDGNLILFPSPLQNSETLGIRYHPVDEGTFLKGVNQTEVQKIVCFLVKQLIDHPEESVGIVAMNAAQMESIDVHFQTQLIQDKALQKAYESNQKRDEPLFIKNLENVQGDERDVIIISMTYAPEIAGAMNMYQRFGPINSDVGWRRLNVLFTRSKMRMHIFSSMTSGHIKTHSASSRGVVALKAFLTYCETGLVQHYQHTGKAADSDFEIAVMNALAERGYACEPQLGVTGYFLDIAVKDPDQTGRFLMGIECDGASYHSAKSTRDRDRLRQEILENLGWRIRRIWSTDWFKNPQAQLEPIFQELDTLRSGAMLKTLSNLQGNNTSPVAVTI